MPPCRKQCLASTLSDIMNSDMLSHVDCRKASLVTLQSTFFQIVTDCESSQ
uniref:Uncharacterized protein n=1 Tax=Anguilla anguilla TaxID=7936 RepID=A0A0E9RQY0_ANGAN